MHKKYETLAIIDVYMGSHKRCFVYSDNIDPPDSIQQYCENLKVLEEKFE